ncbi:MAG: B12-binding domain-containing radical SAM protein [Calditrichaceae bacterium]|nr:B12-binding domain-containing radical SAM protein [Calditrichaceae bacterium]
MKVLLINPPRSPHNKILEAAPEKAKPFIHKKLIGPPLGLLTVASALKDHDVELLETKGEYDLNPDAPELEILVQEYLEKFNPGMVGVTFIASEFNAGIKIFETVKKYNPSILTVAGGLHATLCPDDFRDHFTDMVIPGYSAHVIMKDVVDAMESKKSLSDIGGLLILKDNQWVAAKTAPRTCNPAKQNYIMPDRTLINRWLQTYIVGKAKGPATYLFTSLGCPYRCSFCSIWPQFKGEYFQREVESIIDELKTLDAYEVVRFADANTVVNLQLMNNLFDRIKEEGIKKSFVMDIRPDTIVENPLLIKKMAEAGLIAVITGFESFRKEELKQYNKDYNIDNIEKAIDILHANGVLIRGNYVVPADYDLDDFAALSDFANSHKVTYAGYTILSPMPGTLYYNKVKDQIIDFDLDKYNFFNCVLKTKLPPDVFHENVGKLWMIKKGKDII